MRKTIRSLLVAASLLASTAAVGQPYTGMGPGMGPGMMGPGMMGPGMMGPGMMGPGMMGPGMMGPGMMGSYLGLELSPEQRTKISQIQDELRKKHWALMGTMRDQQYRLQEHYYAPNRDPAAIGAEERKLAELHGQMTQSHVEAQNRVEAVLTNEQKERLRNSGRGWMMRGY